MTPEPQKGVFSADSKELLLEAVSMIYARRVTLVDLGEHKDTLSYGTGLPAPGSVKIDEKERRQFEKVYWLVLRPLYTTLRKCIEIFPILTKKNYYK